MADHDAHLHEVLDGHARFLQDKDLTLDKHQPYLVRWVRDFLLFARAHGGYSYSFEQTLDLFLAEVGGRVGTLNVAWNHLATPQRATSQRRNVTWNCLATFQGGPLRVRADHTQTAHIKVSRPPDAPRVPCLPLLHPLAH